MLAPDIERDVLLATVYSARYSLIDRVAGGDVLPYCEEHGIGALVYSTLHHGLLSGAMTA